MKVYLVCEENCNNGEKKKIGAFRKWNDAVDLMDKRSKEIIKGMPSLHIKEHTYKDYRNVVHTHNSIVWESDYDDGYNPYANVWVETIDVK